MIWKLRIYAASSVSVQKNAKWLFLTWRIINYFFNRILRIGLIIV